MSRDLELLGRALDIPVDWDSLCRRAPDLAALEKLYERLEFISLLRALDRIDPPPEVCTVTASPPVAAETAVALLPDGSAQFAVEETTVHRVSADEIPSSMLGRRSIVTHDAKALYRVLSRCLTGEVPIIDDVMIMA